MDEDSVYKMFFNATQIPLQIFSNGKLLNSYSIGVFDVNPAMVIMASALKTPHRICYTLSPENFYCGLVRVSNTEQCILVGPVLISDCSRLQAQKMLVRLNLSKERTFDFISWLHKIPLYDIHRFQSQLKLLEYLINGNEDTDVVNVPFQEIDTPTIFQTVPEYIDHINNSLEKEITSFIEHGQVKQLDALINNMGFSGSGIPKYSSSDIRDFKNIVIFSTAVASRSAMKGGLDFDTASAMASSYLTKVETLDNTTDIFLILKQMFLDYAKAVSKLNALPTDSILVTRICKEINSHIFEKVTPTLIAKNLKMNAPYLCTHFKKETGKTITEYINEVKIKESTRLLSTTDLSILNISEHLGFATSTYYHTVFKKITGLTPNEYRGTFHI